MVRGGGFLVGLLVPASALAQPPSPESLRRGMTFEAGVGIGWIHDSSDSVKPTWFGGGVNVGAGRWVTDNLAVTGRMAGMTASISDVRLLTGVIVLGVQHWATDHVWLGGGAGLGVFAFKNREDSDGTLGVGLDLRAGYTFDTTSANTLTVSVELTPSIVFEDSGTASIAGIALVVGYQRL